MDTQQRQGQQGQQDVSPQDLSWAFWPIVPIYPYGRRRTLRKEVVKDTIWTFDQLQGIFYVVVPIRMTAIKLDEGGLFIYAPIAPTRECMRLLNELVAEHGDVKYIILPTSSGLEHKVFVSPFARHFPNAQVYVAPKQWSFPFNLPLSWLGFPQKRTQVLPNNSANTPFADQFDYAILGPIELGPGSFTEVAFFHKRSHTLLVTDTVLSVPAEPPAIVQVDPYPLLFHAKDHASDAIADSPANRRLGWQRIALFTFYFRPKVLDILGLGQTLRNAFQASNFSKKAYFGLYPFKWQPNWQQSFERLRGGGRLLVAPILQTLILNRAPKETLNWVRQVASWDLQRIIPCHLDAPIAADSRQFSQAFAFLDKQFSSEDLNQYLSNEDFELLQQIDANLTKLGIIPPTETIC